MSEQYIYFFGEGEADGDGSMKDLLGGKGAGLAEMTNAGVPVPPGFTITTAVCRYYYAQRPTSCRRASRRSRRARARRASSGVMGKQLGDPRDPLLVSVRSGAKFSMPGMMDTILNLGLNDRSVRGARRAAPAIARFAWDCYRRFIQMFGSVVLGLEKREFEELLEALKHKRKVKLDTDLDRRRTSRRWSRDFKALVRKRSAAATSRRIRCEQLALARDAVFRSWNNDRADLLPQAEPDPRRPRHRGQRAGDGVRQPGRRPRAPASASRATRPPARTTSTAST